MIVRCAALAIVAASIAAAAATAANGYVNAQSAGFGAIAIDTDPSGNTADSLGPRQECQEALPGATITIDVTIEGISQATPMLAYAYIIELAGPTLAVTDNEPIKLGSGAGSSVFNASDPLPDFDGMWNGGALDTGTGPNVHETGSGVLERLEIEVSTDAAPAVYTLIITEAVIVDPTSETHSPAVTRNARLAIGVSCAGSTPLPEVTGTPGATGGATQPPGGTTQPPDGATNAPSGTTAPGGATTPPTDGGASAAATDASGTAGASRSPSPGPYDQPSPTASPGDDENGGGSGRWIALAVALIVVAAATGGWFAYRQYRER